LYFSSKQLPLNKFNLILLFIVSTTFLNAQENTFPQDYFRSPLDIPIILSGTFGELRSNHFHAGLDIKTQHRNGLKVYAAAEGYVSRIKVSLWGYGKVIYVEHPNGYTTVYAHLSKFGDGIEEYVKKKQYQKENYETGNIYLEPDVLPVNKGQVIGFTGDTGGFVGPHLHYEIRDSESENIINPLYFGLDIPDNIAPTISKLMVYPIGNKSKVNNGNKKQILPIKKLASGNYITNRVLAIDTIGFAIQTYDRLNNASNKNGVYSIEMEINGNSIYKHDLTTFSFSESKFINLHIDYSHFAQHNVRVQKTHVDNSNKLSIYKTLENRGYINIEEDKSYNVKIIVKDFKGNASTITIPVKGKNQQTSPLLIPEDTSMVVIKAKKFNKFTKNGVTIAFPKNTFYDDTELSFSISGKTAKIHKPIIPLDKSYTLTFDSTFYNPKDVEKLYIANVNNSKYPRYQNTRRRAGKIFTTTKVLGKYTILKDLSKPKIYGANFKNGNWLTKVPYLTVKISDTGSGIKSYNAYIDDEWILMEYDLKRKRLKYNFKDKKLVGSKHIFKLVVSDNVGNTNTYESTFFRK